MMPISLDDPKPSPGAQARPRRRSVIGRIFRATGWVLNGPIDWTGARRIGRGWSLIGDLFTTIRTGPPADSHFKVVEARGFDVVSTAASYGISVGELDARLAFRRRQTCRIAYSAFALAWIFLAGWLWQALTVPSAARVASALCFFPFCLLFLLIAFHNALLNFQIRSGRLASWYEYIQTEDRFWPS